MQIDVKETRPWRWIALAAVIVLAVAAVMAWLSHRRAVLGAKDTVVLADFANSTGDPVFDDTFARAWRLSSGNHRSSASSPISGSAYASPDGPRADARLTPELARGVCERTGSAAVLEGSIAPLGSQYVVTLQARSCRSGEVLDQEQTQAAKKEDVLSAWPRLPAAFGIVSVSR